MPAQLTLVDVNPAPSVAFGPGTRPTLALVDLTPAIGVDFADPSALSLTLATIFKGDQGDTGPQGERGPVGPGLQAFEYRQVAPAMTWVIGHGLGRRPSVTTRGANGGVFVGAVTYVDANTLQLDFTVPVAGFAELN